MSSCGNGCSPSDCRHDGEDDGRYGRKDREMYDRWGDECQREYAAGYDYQQRRAEERREEELEQERMEYQRQERRDRELLEEEQLLEEEYYNRLAEEESEYLEMQKAEEARNANTEQPCP